MEMTDSERGTGIALNFPANDGDDETTTSSPSSSSHSPPKLPRRLRRRLMQQQSKTPITAEEIESKLTQARLRRQVAPLSLSLTLALRIGPRFLEIRFEFCDFLFMAFRLLLLLLLKKVWLDFAGILRLFVKQSEAEVENSVFICFTTGRSGSEARVQPQCCWTEKVNTLLRKVGLHFVYFWTV